jgi:hypothetical protein
MLNNHKLGFCVVFIIIISADIYSQNHYDNGNQAYITEAELGFNNITINNGNFEYQYFPETKQYRYMQYVLIPDLAEEPNGNYIDTVNLSGYGNNINPSDSNFSWDKQSVLGQYSKFDRINMFVSPLSDEIMCYAKALDQQFSICNYGDCIAEISGDIETLAYPDYEPYIGVYQLWTGEELINAGEIKPQGTFNQRYSQQQLDTSQHTSYCVSKYGKGWRLPTDLEVGHFNDEEGIENGFDIAYKGTSNTYCWTSSLFKTFAVKRWPINNLTGEWENCAGFVYVNNHVRCVFPGTNSNNTHNIREQSNNLSVAPIPATDFIKILGVESNYFYKIVNNLGLYIDSGNFEKNNIEISKLDKGLYFINIYDTKKQFKQSLKFIKH